MKLTAWSCVAAVAVALLVLVPAAGGAGPAGVVVNTTADTPDAAAGDGACADSGGACSLRAAIQELNADGGGSVSFAIPGGGVQTIHLASELPAATGISIDARTQPGYAGSPLVELDGSALGGGSTLVLAGHSSVFGLAVGGNATSSGVGIYVTGSGNVVQANDVGTDASGTVARPNVYGIDVSGSTALVNGSNLIGGPGPGDGNLVAGNLLDGIHATSTSGNDTIQGNTIGLDASGAPLGNHQDGVSLSENGATVDGNVIAASGRQGIFVSSDPAAPITATTITRNAIGTDRSGTAVAGNAVSGIQVSGANGTVIGGAPGQGNTIANNQRGVLLTSIGGAMTSNTVSYDEIRGNALYGVGIARQGGNPISGERVSANSIHDNGRLGIDLGINNTPATNGANGDIQRPTIASATSSSSHAHAAGTARGTVTDAPGTQIHVELFSNAACDPSGAGEGQTYLGATDVATDASGTGAWTAVVGAAPVGSFLTATATDPAGNTSEFSTCQAVSAAPSATVSPASVAFGRQPLAGTQVTQPVTVTNDGTLPVTLTAETVTGSSEFTAGAPGTTTLAPGASTQVPVTFTPAAAGVQTATLEIDSNADPLTVSLSGEAVAPPTAAPDAYTTSGTLTVPAPGVLGNDSDAIGSTLTAVLDSAPAQGTLSLASDGSFTYVPAPGFSGPVTVTYSAVSPYGSSAPATVSITVTDTVPPVLSGVPTGLTVDATSPAGAVVSWPAPTAVDAVSGPVPVTCAPASGSTFAIGTTTVTCSATDGAGNTASGHFTVTVLGASDQLAHLIDETVSYLGGSTSGPLRGQLVTALAQLGANHPKTTCVLLDVYAKLVRQTPHGLTAAEKAQLVADADRIRAVLGC